MKNTSKIFKESLLIYLKPHTSFPYMQGTPTSLASIVNQQKIKRSMRRRERGKGWTLKINTTWTWIAS